VFCQHHAVQLDGAREQIEADGAKLVFIGQATPRQAAHFRRRRNIVAPVLADETRATYKLVGAKKGSTGQLIGPKVVAKGAVITARTGILQTKTIGNAAQLGGAMVIAPDGSVVWSQMAKDASDNASAQDIISAVQSARQLAG
jgi:peroxiredoxin